MQILKRRMVIKEALNFLKNMIYIDKIFVKAYAEEEYVEVVSKYGSCKFPIDKQSRWESGEIGLSYACCEVSITFIP